MAIARGPDAGAGQAMSAIDAPDDVAAELEANAPDSARWLTLAIILISAFIVVLDNTVLNVAIPTILRDFHTSLLSVEWVITGYALTFASLLIIGGRLGDIYGHRRIFIIGCSLFATGSLIAALSQGVRELILGEAVIEGMGASLMLPNTIAILSSTFRGRERASAFAAWGAAAGVGSAVGPTVGGFDKDEGTPGPLQLQHHGNRVQFRNVWVVEKK